MSTIRERLFSPRERVKSMAGLRFKNGLLEGNVNADKLTDFQIEVTGLTTLGADDFLL